MTERPLPGVYVGMQGARIVEEAEAQAWRQWDLKLSDAFLRMSRRPRKPSTGKLRRSVPLATLEKKKRQAIRTISDATAEQTAQRLLHPKTGEHLKPTLTPREAADVLGWPERTIRDYCHDGILPVMPRRGSRGQYRIKTAALLRELGLLNVDQEVTH